MKCLNILLTLVLTSLLLWGCAKSSKNSENTVRVGTIAGPETQLVEVAKSVAARDHQLNIEIVQFTDYVMPNQALFDGSIDANMYQHLPFLQEAIAAKGYRFVPIGKTFIYPMGIYSSKIKNLADLKSGAIVAIPNDPSNEARALLLLEKVGLIRLKSTNLLRSNPRDIIDNPKLIVVKELDAAQLPRLLPDVDIAVINTNYAMVAGLLPSRDALALEDKDSPYANLVVVKESEKNDPKFQKLMSALHSSEVLEKAKRLFQGQAIPAWK